MTVGFCQLQPIPRGCHCNRRPTAVTDRTKSTFPFQSQEGSRLGHHRVLHAGLRDDVPGAHVRGRGVPHRRQLHLPLHQVLRRLPLRHPRARLRHPPRGRHQEGHQVSYKATEPGPSAMGSCFKRKTAPRNVFRNYFSAVRKVSTLSGETLNDE